MIKYVLILLWFDAGAFYTENPAGKAWINHFDTMPECMEALATIPSPKNPNIEWYAVSCNEFTFNNTRGITANGSRALPGDWF